MSSTSSVVFGMASHMLFTGLVGPILSFIGGASAGFIGGVVHRWRTDCKEAIAAMNDYPGTAYTVILSRLNLRFLGLCH